MFEIAKVGHQRFAKTFKDIRIGKKEGRFRVYNDYGNEEELESDWSIENF